MSECSSSGNPIINCKSLNNNKDDINDDKMDTNNEIQSTSNPSSPILLVENKRESIENLTEGDDIVPIPSIVTSSMTNSSIGSTAIITAISCTASDVNDSDISAKDKEIFKLIVKAVFHAEMNSEPTEIVDSVSPTHSGLKRKRNDSVKMKPINFDEIIPIHDNTSWEDISKNEEDREEQTLNISKDSVDTLSADDKSDFSSSPEPETTEKNQSENKKLPIQSKSPSIFQHSITDNPESTQIESWNSGEFSEKSISSWKTNIKRGAGEFHPEDEATSKMRKFSSYNENDKHLNIIQKYYESHGTDMFDLVKSSDCYDKGQLNPYISPLSHEVHKNYSKYSKE